MEKLLSFDPKKCKTVLAGYYYYNGNFFLKKVTSKHFMIKEQGYGIQEDVIEKLKERGCKNIIIKTPTKKIETTFDEWLNEGNVKNYGHGLQRFLKIRR